MADEEAPPTKSYKGLWVLLISVLLSIAAAVAAFYFLQETNTTVITPETAGTAEQKEPVIAKKSSATPVFYQIKPDFIVNLEKEKPVRFLQVQVQIMSRDIKAIAACEKYEPLIKDAIIAILSQKKASELNTDQGKERLRKEVLMGVQKVMKDEVGKAGIENVLFTHFLIQ